MLEREVWGQGQGMVCRGHANVLAMLRVSYDSRLPCQDQDRSDQVRSEPINDNTAGLGCCEVGLHGRMHACPFYHAGLHARA